ncbi:MAG: glycosyltransferase family 4 protein [Planctomycetaceae bacterium]
MTKTAPDCRCTPGLGAAVASPCADEEATGLAPPPEEAGQRVRALFYAFFPGSGIGRYTHELLRELSRRRDVSAELACLPNFHWRDQATYPVWPGLREISHPRAWRRRLRFVLAQVENPRRLIARARATDAAVVHLSNINHLTFPLWNRWLRKGSLRVVATVHDVRRQRGIINLRYEERQLQRFYQQADGLFVHSHSQLVDLTTFADVDPARVHIVPHGPYDYGPASAPPEILRSRLGLPLDRQVALFFGNVRDEKNLDLLLEVLPPFADQVHLVVAGPTDVPGHKGRAHYRGRVESLGLTDAVTFIDGYIPDQSIPDLFAACDWVAMPYSRTFTSQSGVLNVAMSYHRPVLATSAPTLAETLAGVRVGVVVEPDCREALAAGTSRLQGRLAAAETWEFGEYLRRFSWAENARQTAEVYRALGAPDVH